MLNEVPGWQQAVFIPCASGSGSPVGFELRESYRVQLPDGRTERCGVSLWQRDNWLLPIHGYTAHKSMLGPEAVSTRGHTGPCAGSCATAGLTRTGGQLLVEQAADRQACRAV